MKLLCQAIYIAACCNSGDNCGKMRKMIDSFSMLRRALPYHPTCARCCYAVDCLAPAYIRYNIPLAWRATYAR